MAKFRKISGMPLHLFKYEFITKGPLNESLNCCYLTAFLLLIVMIRARAEPRRITP